jgi:hypothetical protein
MAMRADVVAIAAGHSRAMADAGTIWHNSNYFTNATRSALAGKSLGENVAMNMSVDLAHVALMNSPGHRANILKPEFTVTGMAVVQAGGGALFITQNFVQPSGAAPRGVAPKPAPKPAAVKAVTVRPPVATKAAVAAPAPPPETTTTVPPTTAPPVASEGELAAAPIGLSAPPLEPPDDQSPALAGMAMVLLLTVGTVSLRAATRR